MGFEEGDGGLTALGKHGSGGRRCKEKKKKELSRTLEDYENPRQLA